MKSIVTTMFMLLLALITHARISSVWLNQNYPDSLAKVYNNKGVDFAVVGNFDSAAVYFGKSLKIRESIPNYPKQKLASGFINLAVLRMNMCYYDSALLYFDKAEVLLTGDNNDILTLLGVLLVERGNCLSYKQEYNDAIIHIIRGINLLLADSNANVSKLIPAYQKLSNAYLQSGKIDDATLAATRVYRLSLDFNRSYLFHASQGVGNCHFFNEKYGDALKYYTVALSEAKKRAKINRMELVGLYNSIALSNWRIGVIDSAEFYFIKAVDTYPNSKVYTNFYGNMLRNYARFLLSQRRHQLALRFFNLSISINQKHTDNLYAGFPSTSWFYSPQIAIRSYMGKGDVYKDLFQNTGVAYYADSALFAYKISIGLIEQIKGQLQEENDKLWLSESFHSSYLKAIEVCALVGESDPDYLQFAFALSSKAKASVLSQAIERDMDLSFSGVPNELIHKERSLKLEISKLKERLFEEEKKVKPSGDYIKSLQERIFVAQREFNKLILNLERKYPEYFALKYDTASVLPGDVMKVLKNNQLLIDYIISGNHLVSFAVSKNSFRWHVTPIDSTFYEQFKILMNELNPSSFENLNRSNITRFSESSNFFFKHLIEPYQAISEGKELIIIPHLMLSSVPFSALVKKSSDNPRGYYDLQYLILTNPVSYFPSSKLFCQKKSISPTFGIKALSFAPDYKNYSDSLSSLPYRQNLVDLPGAEMESRAIIDIFGGKLVQGSQATEERFKLIASDFEVLHLAMHTHINESNHLYTKLVFANQNGNTEDGLLNIFEIYGLRIECSMAMISACRSSDGSLVKGEGLISLARSFQYAGCPSLVAALWQVDDFSGKQIMVNFSENIMQGKTKSVALQLSQISFIQNTDPLRSHPYFWASYQLIGDDSPLTYSRVTKTIISLLFVLLILSAGITMVLLIKRKFLK